jgi:hypothetical protein
MKFEKPKTLLHQAEVANDAPWTAALGEELDQVSIFTNREGTRKRQKPNRFT